MVNSLSPQSLRESNLELANALPLAEVVVLNNSGWTPNDAIVIISVAVCEMLNDDTKFKI